MLSVLKSTECTQYDTLVSCLALPKLRLESHGFMRVLWDFSAFSLAPAPSWDCYGPSGKAGIVLSFHRCVAEGHLLLLIDQHCRCCSWLARLALGGSWRQEFEHGLLSMACGPVRSQVASASVALSDPAVVVVVTMDWALLPLPCLGQFWTQH